MLSNLVESSGRSNALLVSPVCWHALLLSNEGLYSVAKMRSVWQTGKV